MNHTRMAVAQAADLTSRLDRVIRHISYIEWHKLRPSVCEWEDVAQEVRLAFLMMIPRIATAVHPAAFTFSCVRYQARRALWRLARDEVKLGDKLLHIEDDPTTGDLFYSSTGSASDDYLD